MSNLNCSYFSFFEYTIFLNESIDSKASSIAPFLTKPTYIAADLA